MIKYENARSLKFNIWLFIATQLIVITASVFAAYRSVVDKFDPFMHENFNEWLEALVRVNSIPGARLTQHESTIFLERVAEIPSIHAQFVAGANLIFKWAPVGAVIATTVIYIVGHAVAGYFKQTRKGK